MTKFLLSIVAVCALLGVIGPTGAQAGPILAADFGVNIPFGPFFASQPIVIKSLLTNTSSTETLSICDGVCVGGPNTFSLGGAAFIPNGYSFLWGDGGGSEPSSGAVWSD